MQRFPNRIRTRFVLTLVSILLAGCAATTPAPVSSPSSTASAGSGDSGNVRRALYEQLERWGGTKYRLGGMGGQGIDCSGLTYVVYRDVFDLHLPRTAEQQGKTGHPVERRELAPGDLVFFKTGLRRRHVGIYVEDNMFLHVSKSDGVRMSSLSNDYWRKRYWKARRMSAKM